MAETNTKLVQTPVKSFMTAGPTLHYSHSNVLWFWFLTVFIFVSACYFWNRILTGGPITVNFADMVDPSLFSLGRLVTHPISIYEYPWHIVVLGVLMGLFAVGPLLVSQLLSFRYSIPMVLAVMFIAKLHLFGLFLLVGCFAVACRPLRFRSRFIAIALCMAPQLIYFAIWGGQPAADPVRWGFSFAPWIYAWISALFMAAVVLGIGHFTRYKPGLIWLITLCFLTVSYAAFQRTIGFAELDYQLYVAGSNPDDVIEFQEKSIAPIIDEVIRDDALRSLLVGRFYPTEPIALRQKLKEEIQSLLVYDRWPQWFQKKMPQHLRYASKRRELINRYELFMERWPDSRRKAIALYHKALLSEYHPDIRALGTQEVLRFYSDYPFHDNLLTWQELFNSFPQSPESIEARWRMAKHEAGKGNFEAAEELCQVALTMIREQFEKQPEPQMITDLDSIFTAFRKPSRTAMTPNKLRDLQSRFRLLASRISRENRGPDDDSRRRLAVFVMLNSNSSDYGKRLEELLAQMSDDDALADNVRLELAMLNEDPGQRAQLLAGLIQQFPQTDAGIRAKYELGILKIKLWKNPQNSDETKKRLLNESRTILAEFYETYPDSPFSDQAKAMLQTLPAIP